MSRFLERVQRVNEQLHELVQHLDVASETSLVYCHDIKETLSVLSHDLTCAVMDDDAISETEIVLPQIFTN